MNFASDNVYGVSAQVMDALRESNEGPSGTYGGDAHTKRAETMIDDVFETGVSTFLVTTGTAANALSLAAITPSYRAVLCHHEAHVHVDECGSIEFQTGGSKVLVLEGDDAKIDIPALERTFGEVGQRMPHQIGAASLSLTQASEFGTVYSLDEIAAICDLAHAYGLKVHMDGARFANALVALGCTAAEMTWKAGVDVLSFGATKNGAMALDAALFFDAVDAESFPFRRLRSGQLWSKGRFLGAQMCGYLENGLWLDNARQANAMAAKLSEGLVEIGGVRLSCPCQANEMFPVLPRAMHERLQASGAVYYEWPGAGPKGPGLVGGDEVLARLITSFEATDEQVGAFLALARDAAQ